MSALIYEQVFEDIKSKINSAILKPGELIPSENSLSKEYNATRMTIRKGLALLTENGYIYPVPGKGYYVCTPDNKKHILFFNEMDIIKTHAAKTQLLEVNIIPPGKDLSKHLQLEKGQKAVVIRRLFHTKREPFAYDIKYMPFDKGKPIVEEVIHYATFPEIVAGRTTVFAVKNELKIWTKGAQGEEARILKAPEGSPLMVVEQKLFGNENKPMGWGQIFFKENYCCLHAISSL